MSVRPVDYDRAMGLIRNLGPILSRQYQGPHYRIRDRFWSVLTTEMYRQMYGSLKFRSVGHNDDHGDVWSALKPSTIKRKSKAGRRGGRYLPASRHPEDINYDTGDLLESFAPGTVVNDNYRPPNRNQRVELQASGVRLGTNIPYAAKVDRIRKMFPRSYQKWVHYALSRAAEAIIPLIENP